MTDKSKSADPKYNKIFIKSLVWIVMKAVAEVVKCSSLVKVTNATPFKIQSRSSQEVKDITPSDPPSFFISSCSMI